MCLPNHSIWINLPMLPVNVRRPPSSCVYPIIASGSTYPCFQSMIGDHPAAVFTQSQNLDQPTHASSQCLATTQQLCLPNHSIWINLPMLPVNEWRPPSTCVYPIIASGSTYPCFQSMLGDHPAYTGVLFRFPFR